MRSTRTAMVVAVLAALLAGCATNDLSRQFHRKYNAPPMKEQVAMVMDPDDPDRRREGLEYLASGPTAQDEATLKLFALLASEDSSPFVRSSAVNALGNAENPTFADVLISRLNDQSPMVRAEAAKALGKVISDEALAPLIHSAISDEEVSVRFQAVRSIPAYRNEKAIRTLVELLDDRELTVRREAHKALVASYGVDLGTEYPAWAARAAEGLPPVDAPKTSRWKRWWKRRDEVSEEAAEETAVEDAAWSDDYNSRYGEDADTEPDDAEDDTAAPQPAIDPPDAPLDPAPANTSVEMPTETPAELPFDVDVVETEAIGADDAPLKPDPHDPARPVRPAALPED